MRAAPLSPTEEAKSRVPPLVSTGPASRAAGCSISWTKRLPARALASSTAHRLAVETV